MLCAFIILLNSQISQADENRIIKVEYEPVIHVDSKISSFVTNYGNVFWTGWEESDDSNLISLQHYSIEICSPDFIKIESVDYLLTTTEGCRSGALARKHLRHVKQVGKSPLEFYYKCNFGELNYLSSYTVKAKVYLSYGLGGGSLVTNVSAINYQCVLDK